MSIESQKLQQVSQVNLEMIQGNDEIYRSTIKTRNYITKILEVYDLSTATEITMIIEDKLNGTVFWTGTMTGGEITLEDAPNGQYRVDVPDTTTTTIPVGVWNYHIKVTTATGAIRTAVMGKIRVIDD